MSTYTPEQGQAAFGQPWAEHAVPDYVDAALGYIDKELDRVMRNERQQSWDSPFSNTGSAFKCPVFEVCAYSWGDDEQPFNFKWGEVEIRWYKWCGRGMSSNVEFTPALAAEMLAACVAYLRKRDGEPPR